jgi:hypothetical protein
VQERGCFCVLRLVLHDETPEPQINRGSGIGQAHERRLSYARHIVEHGRSIGNACALALGEAVHGKGAPQRGRRRGIVLPKQPQRLGVGDVAQVPAER